MRKAVLHILLFVVIILRYTYGHEAQPVQWDWSEGR